jgi:hypothetical protein
MAKNRHDSDYRQLVSIWSRLRAANFKTPLLAERSRLV